MSNKDWFDDYMDYKLSGCESKKKTSENSGCATWILGALIVLKLFLGLFD